MIEAELHVLTVLVSQRRKRQHDARNVNAFVVRNLAADNDFRVGEIFAAIGYLEPDLPIVHQEVAAGLQRGKYLLMRQADAIRVSRSAIHVETERLSRLQKRRTFGKVSDPQFRSL